MKLFRKRKPHLIAEFHKVGQSEPPLVLTSGLTGYNCPGQYSLKWSVLVSTGWSGRLEFLSGCCFCDGLIYWARLCYSYSREIKKKWTVSVLI